MLTQEEREMSLMRRTTLSETGLLYGVDDVDPLYLRTVRKSMKEWLQKDPMTKEIQRLMNRTKEEEGDVERFDEDAAIMRRDQLLDEDDGSEVSVADVIRVKDAKVPKEEEVKVKKPELQCVWGDDEPKTSQARWKEFFVVAKEELEENPNAPIFRNINDIYRFRGRIRNGTYTTVNKYYSHILKEEIAIKIIPKIGFPKKRLFKFVPRELDVAECKDFKHPNIVKFLGTHDIGLRCYIMMEYVENGTLTEYVQSKGRLDPFTYHRFFTQLINAVCYCYRRGVCHRKLSTENCLVTKDLDLKLCDFSYSRVLDSELQASATYCGVLGFTAPEILMCRNYQPCMTDAWSCGVILYVMIYGAMPFDSSNFAKLMKQVLKPLKYHWYPDTPIDAIMIMDKTISPIKRRWSIRKVLSHRWISPRSTKGYRYIMKLIEKETDNRPVLDPTDIIAEMREVINREFVLPLKMRKKPFIEENDEISTTTIEEEGNDES